MRAEIWTQPKKLGDPSSVALSCSQDTKQIQRVKPCVLGLVILMTQSKEPGLKATLAN